MKMHFHSRSLFYELDRLCDRNNVLGVAENFSETDPRIQAAARAKDCDKEKINIFWSHA